MERKYFTINEGSAKIAHDMNSLRSFQSGQETAQYKENCDEVYNLAEEANKRRPDEAEKITYYAERYAAKMASWMNTGYQIEAMCPSIMISGGSNFPVRKKNKQNNRRDAHFKEYEYIKSIPDKIRSIMRGDNIIKSNDEQAIEKLEEKLATLVKSQEVMKATNAYFRKHKSLDGCPDLSPEVIEKLKASMASSWRASRGIEQKPFETFALTNNNANIKRVRDRLNNLKAVKAKETTETAICDESENEKFKVVENTENMRIQLIFPDKPSDEVRSILKSNGFKWAPSQNAWQRQLTQNGRYALKRVLEKIS